MDYILHLIRDTHTAIDSRLQIREIVIWGIFAGDNREVALTRCVNVKMSYGGGSQSQCAYHFRERAEGKREAKGGKGINHARASERTESCPSHFHA